MADTREYLPAGTKIKLDTGNVYEITGTPVGCGGGSILYPVQRLVFYDGSAQPDGFFYVLKECYPVSGTCSFVRNVNGEIVPENRNDDSEYYLSRAQKLLLKEDRLSRAVYQTASRMIPTRESASGVVLEIPGKTATMVSNTVTVMESLSEKGRSITAWLKEKRRFSPFETFRIVQQLLFALKEVHQAGYLHLDIQDGNVFLKGTLEQKDELVTLIDFGSARPMVDGRTAPIQDRVIFTTPGFAAPEIMLHNDGTLQLGAETDIYSVGCLALYLLTGSKPETRMLLENRTGIFLKPNQLRRIKCPRHLIDRMQQILATALNRKPQNRYHSVEEMLRDVTDLVEALRPYRTDLSAVKYDAFVCYKHGPIDSEAAVTLQRELENYRAPKGISQNKKPFKRVFVDEGELSSCADFGQQIREALQNSGWLIVVCSEDTPNSPWVQLEIDTFLETHSRSRVLCVMTGGDEKVSFPPQLKGNQTNEGEVLAADARGSDIREVKKKLRKDALLKIVAPMLGTTFDSLKQRHKLYRMQKIAAVTAGILSVTAGFAAYAVNRAHVISEQAVRIEQEYENALINESLLLAEQAQKRLDDNNPLGAMELALQALPSEEQDRPVLTEVEYVLGKALGIYTTPASVINTASVADIIETELSNFFLSKNGKYLVTWEEYEKIVQIIDAGTFEVISDIELAGDPIQLSEELLIADSTLIIPTENLITCVDFLTGETCWSVVIDSLFSVCVSEDEQKVVAFSGDRTSYDTSQIQTFNIFSAETGSVLKTMNFVIPVNDFIQDEISVSPDMKWAAIQTYNSGDYTLTGSGNGSVYLVDLETGTVKQLIEIAEADEQEIDVDAVKFLKNGISVIRYSGGSALGGFGKYSTLFADPCTVWLEFYNLETGSLIWQSKHIFYSVHGEGGISTSALVRYQMLEDIKEGILYTFANRCVLVDFLSGETIRIFELSSSIADVHYLDDGVIAVTTDGAYHSSNYQTERVLRIKMFDDSISSLCRNGTTFYIRYGTMFEEENRIVKYELDRYDDSYVQLSEVGDSSTWDRFALYDICSDSDRVRAIFALENQVCFVDTPNNTVNVYDIPEEYEFDEYSILGVSDDFSKIYWECYDWEDRNLWINSCRFYSLDLFTGKVTELKIPQKPESLGYISAKEHALYDEKMLFIATEDKMEYKDLILYCWNFLDGSLTEMYRKSLHQESDVATRTQRFENYIDSSLKIDRESQQVQFAVGLSIYYFDESGHYTQSVNEIPQQLVRIDLNDGNSKAVKIAINLAFEPGDEATYLLWMDELYQWNSAGTEAVFGFNNCFYILDTNGKLLWKMPVTEQVNDIGFSQDSDVLYVLSHENVFSSYCVSDGTLQYAINLNDYIGTSMTTAKLGKYWEDIDQTMLLIHFTRGSLLFDVSCDTCRIKAVIDECVGYNSEKDGFFVILDDHLIENTIIGYFPRYTVDDLIRKAKDILS